MRRTGTIISFITTLITVSAVHARTGWAQTLKPFTPVPDVCPKCTTGPKYDHIVLRDGADVKARVLAENDRFYVLERFGELRAVGRDKVKSIEKNPAVERPAGYSDQILFRDGIVLAGTLKTESDAADPFVLEVPLSASTHTAFRNTIALVYRGGRLIFRGPEVALAGARAR